jgi:hypothetical protein
MVITRPSAVAFAERRFYEQLGLRTTYEGPDLCPQLWASLATLWVGDVDS